MKHSKHASHSGDGKSSRGRTDARGKSRHTENAEQESKYSHEGYYPPMASSYSPEQYYSPQQQYRAQHDQPAYYGQSVPPAANSASAGPTSLSAILNHNDPEDDYTGYANAYPSSTAAAAAEVRRPTLPPDARLGSSSSIGSSGASHSKMALHNALSPVVPSAGDAAYYSAPHAYRSHDSYTTYASAEDFQKGKASLDNHYYHSYSSTASDSYSHEHYASSSRGTDRRTSSSSRDSKHYTHTAAAAAVYAPVEQSPLGPPGPARSETGNKTKTQRTPGASPPSNSSSHRAASHYKPAGRRDHSHSSSYLSSTGTPATASAGFSSSPAFSAPDTHGGQQTPRPGSVDMGSYARSSSGGTEGDFDDQDEDAGGARSHHRNRTRDREHSSARSLVGGPGSEQQQQHHHQQQHPPAVQRERNRAAATKCRAKSKAAVSKLEEEERIMSDQRQALVAQKSALVDEVLTLREELLRHGGCESGSFIRKYIDNAAHTIAETGGRNPIWGPNGTGAPWTEDHGHDRVKKEHKRK